MGRSSKKKGKARVKGSLEKPKNYCSQCKTFIADATKGKVCPGGCDRIFCNRCIEGSIIELPAFSQCAAGDSCPLPARCNDCWSGKTVVCSNSTCTPTKCVGLGENALCEQCAGHNLDGKRRMETCSHCCKAFCSSCREADKLDAVRHCSAPGCSKTSCGRCALILSCPSCQTGYCCFTCFDQGTKVCNKLHADGCGRQICAACDPNYNVEKSICSHCHIVSPFPAMLHEGRSGSEKVDCNTAAVLSADDDSVDLFNSLPPRVECPICMLPLPSLHTHMACCGKLICSGCYLENKRVINEINAKNAQRNNGRAKLVESCAFCRTPPPRDLKEYLLRLKKRMEVGDAAAFSRLGEMYMNGDRVFKNEKKGFSFYLRAANLGCVASCFFIAECYRFGIWYVKKDKMKERWYSVQGTKGGDASARYHLAGLEWESGNTDLAVKHLLISAGAGHQLSLDGLKFLYQKEDVSKDDFVLALRSFQSARDEEKSASRDRWTEENAKGERGG